MKKLISLIATAAFTATLLAGCSSSTTQVETATTETVEPTIATSLSTSSGISNGRLSLLSSEAFSASDYEVGYIASVAIPILLADGASSSQGSGVTIEGNVITISSGGTYLLSGSLTDGQIVVDCDKDDVQLVLDGVTLSNTSTAPIYIVSADNAYITTSSGTQNTITATLVEDETAETNVDAAIFSKADLSLNGEGALVITATAGNGITSKDDLIVTSGSYTITADKHGLEANDSIRIAGGTFSLVTQKDGLHCENEDDTEKGYIFIIGGSLTIDAQGDGMDSSSQIEITGGTFNITTAGGYDSTAAVTTTSSMPGMQSGMSAPGQMSGQMGGQMGTLPEATTAGMEMGGDMMQNARGTGTMTQLAEPETELDTGFTRETPEMTEGQMGGRTDMMGQMGSTSTTTTEDDSVSTKGIKANTYLLLSDGVYQINAQDDALHANIGVEILGGTYVLQTGDDAIHSDLDTMIAGGTINITACYEGIEGERVEIAGGVINIKSDDDGINASRNTGSDGEVDILISGGELFIDCDYEGDGFDSNGTILVTGGSVLIYGTTDTRDTTLDYGGSSVITGGTFIAAGSASQTTQNFGTDSTQGSILVQLSSTVTGEFTLTDSSGNIIAQTTPTKSYQVVIVSSPDIVVGETYTLTAGDYVETIVMDSLIYGSGNEHSMMGGQMGGMTGMQGGQMSGGMGRR